MVRASLSSVAEKPVDENAGFAGPVPQPVLAANLESHITETLAADAPAPAVGLAGEGEVSSPLKIHHDEPAVDPTLAEKISIYISEMHLADIYIRECDGTACVIFHGEVVVTIEDHLSRHGAISAAAHELYGYLMTVNSGANKILAGHLNAHIANTIDDPTKIVPAGESCEWPLSNKDEEEAADDVNADGDVECAADDDDLLGEAPADEAAVEIPALAGEACGGEGVVEAAPAADDYEADVEKAHKLYDRALAAAKDRYVSASQSRVQLQESVKSAKEWEAERLEEIGAIENRGWRYFMPAKPKPAATSNETPSPSIPSPASTLPPPSPEHQNETPSSPQAGVSGASDQGSFRPDWSSVSIDELKLPKGITEKLKEHGCETIGKLEAKRATFDGLKGIPSIGEAKRDAIEEAVLGWLSKYRDASELNAVREKNREAAVAGEGVALEMAAQGQ